RWLLHLSLGSVRPVYFLRRDPAPSQIYTLSLHDALPISRPRTFANLISVKAHTSTGEYWVEGTIFGNDSPRVVSVDGVSVEAALDRKSTRLNSSHVKISYAVFCLKKKTSTSMRVQRRRIA